MGHRGRTEKTGGREDSTTVLVFPLPNGVKSGGFQKELYNRLHQLKIMKRKLCAVPTAWDSKSFCGGGVLGGGSISQVRNPLNLGRKKDLTPLEKKKRLLHQPQQVTSQARLTLANSEDRSLQKGGGMIKGKS